TCIKSFGSRTRKTSVSTIWCSSRLNEYCTLEYAPPARSCLMRTKSAVALESVGSALLAAMASGFALASSKDLPRSTSKSGLNDGFMGTPDSAEAICFCSSADGVQTFKTLTLTCGCGCEASVCARQTCAATTMVESTRIFGNTAKL